MSYITNGSCDIFVAIGSNNQNKNNSDNLLQTNNTSNLNLHPPLVHRRSNTQNSDHKLHRLLLFLLLLLPLLLHLLHQHSYNSNNNNQRNRKHSKSDDEVMRKIHV